MIPIFFWKAVVFVFGLCIGSFLNVCIYRIPKRKSIVFPASHCPRCKKPLKWYHNIPVLSFIFLRGKCAFCGKSISLCYPIVELISGVFALISFNRFYLEGGNFYLFLIYYAFLCSLIVITGIDLKYFIIPDVIDIPGILFGIIFSTIFPLMQNADTHFKGGLYALLSVLISAGTLYFIAVIGSIIFRKEAMGLGDVKLAGLFGAFLGYKLALLSIFLSSVIGSIFGIAMILFGKAKLQTRIPFGPYLAAGAFISLFYGEEIINLYVKLLTAGL